MEGIHELKLKEYIIFEQENGYQKIKVVEITKTTIAFRNIDGYNNPIQRVGTGYFSRYIKVLEEVEESGKTERVFDINEEGSQFEVGNQKCFIRGGYEFIDGTILQPPKEE